MKKKKRRLQKLIGRREFVDFPELSMKNIEAKIDTGAYTSAMHCHDISERLVNGKKVLCFYLLDPTHEEYNQTEHCFSEYGRKVIKSSSGEPEERFIIKTLVKIGGKKIRTTISLTDRANMRYPMLIGRRLLKTKFIVDVARIHTGGVLLKKAFS